MLWLMRSMLLFALAWLSPGVHAGTVTITGDASTWVDSTSPDSNFYYNGVFAVDSVRTGFIRFLADSTLCTSNIIHAELRITPISSANGLQTVHRMVPVSWSPPDVTWATRPVAEAEVVGMFGPVATGINADAVPIVVDITSAYFANKCDALTLSVTGNNDVRLFVVAAGQSIVHSPVIVVEYGPADPASQTMSTFQIVAYCLTAFGLGYAAGSVQRIVRRSIETLD